MGMTLKEMARPPQGDGGQPQAIVSAQSVTPGMLGRVDV
jgi:hypothetical protein